MIHAVVHASAGADPNTVLTWLTEAFKPESTVDSLHEVPTTLLSIDGKLVTALQHILNAAGTKGKTLVHQIQMKMQKELETHSRLLGGRQTLFMVSQAFVTTDNTETYLGVEHLAHLTVHNSDLEKFWLNWEQIVSQLPPKSVLPRGLETMLYNKVRKLPEPATVNQGLRACTRELGHADVPVVIHRSPTNRQLGQDASQLPRTRRSYEGTSTRQD